MFDKICFIDQYLFIIYESKVVYYRKGDLLELNTKNMKKYLVLIAVLIIVAVFVPACDLEYYVDDSTPVSGNLDVYFIDVGQGDSIFIHTPSGNTILIDGGEANQGDNVLNFLQDQGVDKLDVVIATHAHADHIGGLITVMENMDVDAVYMPKAVHNSKTFERFVLAVKEKGLKFKSAYAGVELSLEDVNAKFVGPAQKDSYDDLNNSSAVLRLVYGDVGFLFTGDAEIESEDEMLSSGQRLEAHVLKVGHHGSTTSTSEEFLREVSPEHAIISCGAGNKYGHPHDEIIERLEDEGISVYRTDEEGTVHIICDGEDIEVR